jgi:hypothetical protein
MVNMLQNANRRVTRNDIRYAFAAAYLTIYQGKTMYSISGTEQITLTGNCPFVNLYCVKKIGGKNKILWKISTYTVFSVDATTVTVELRETPVSITGLNLDDISIGEGEIRIVICCCRYFLDIVGEKRRLINGRRLCDMTPRESFGFFIFNPKECDRDSKDTRKVGRAGFFFPSLVIFTPKPGLFDETAPAN